MNQAINVLIVDDEERFRTILAKLLGTHGVNARSVGSGAEALEEIANNPYEVVLLDVKMPGMTGIEALAEIKRRSPDVEVIILTGHASVDAAVEIMRLGGADYLLKPCPVEEFSTRSGWPWSAVASARTGE